MRDIIVDLEPVADIGAGECVRNELRLARQLLDRFGVCFDGRITNVPAVMLKGKVRAVFNAD